MSHFTVLVIGENIEAQLQAFHEYECTGVLDQYVVAIDETDERKKDYETDTTSAVMKDGQFFGTKYCKKCEQFWKRSGIGISTSDEFILPSGYTLVDGYPLNKVYATFEEYMMDWCSEKIDEGGRVIRYTNPNAKWDWWVVGGRWTGMLRLKPGAHGETGKPGILTPSAKEGYCDSALKMDIDFEYMRQEAGNRAADLWETVNASIPKTENFKSWKEITEGEKYGDEQRAIYNAQPEVIAFSKLEIVSWRDKVEDYLILKDTYVNNAKNAAGVTFAIVKDGQWFEKGEMGWWGMVSDEKEQEEWNKQFHALIDTLPDDTLLTVVDCHI